MELAYDLRYGGRQVRFYKSTRYVGARLAPDAITSFVLPARTRRLDYRLSGFDMFDVSREEDSVEPALNALRRDWPTSVFSHSFHTTSTDRVPLVPTGEIHLVVDERVGVAGRDALLREHHLALVTERNGKRLDVIARVTRPSPNPVKVAVALQQVDGVRIAEPDFATRIRFAALDKPGDPGLRDQWHLENTGNHNGDQVLYKQGADARVVEAWLANGSLGDANVVVAVIDDGFDLAHTDLTGDGKLVNPWDFRRNSDAPAADKELREWHGTACAGLAIANANGVGVVGVAPACRFMPLRMGAELTDAELERWFAHARDKGAWVVSCSWHAATPRFVLSERTQEALRRCASEGRGGLGSVICFAAGNEDSDIDSADAVNGFATHPNVIAVSGTSSKDERYALSNFGAAVTVCAPCGGYNGPSLLTTDFSGTFELGTSILPAGRDGSDYSNFGGTSAACAVVAGVCALVLSARPELSAADVKRVLMKTARNHTGGVGKASDYPAGHSRNFGAGCVNAAAAVRLAKETPIPVP
jgi:subtilisin family serine protease